MKLNPKLATFCPGCNHSKLELKAAPELIIKAEEKAPTKRITILSETKKTNKGLF